MLRQVCEALEEAHTAGLVHRDIKPANILACHTGGKHDVAKLLDFGLVAVQPMPPNGESLSGTETITGTPAFMSPEQASGTACVDARTDIYSLGAVAYFLLTGRPPFMHSTSVETMAAHLTEPVLSVRQSRTGFLPIWTALSSDVSRRTRSNGSQTSSSLNRPWLIASAATHGPRKELPSGGRLVG